MPGRHLKRHEEKDEEAGGKGMGILLTRKRVWDPKIGYTSRKRKKAAESISPKTTSTPNDEAESLPSILPSPNVESAGTNNNSLDEETTSHPVAHTRSFSSSSAENIFAHEGFIDTAHSFNLPFTTLNDYSWIFEDTPFLKEFNSSVPLSFPLINQNKDIHGSVSHKLSSAWVDSAENYNFDSDYYAEPIIPVLDNETRARLVKFIIKSTVQDGVSLFSEKDEILQPNTLQECVTSYFTKFNITYPLIHCISFNPSQVNSLLLASIILIGASYGSKKVHQSAVKIHDCLRGVLFSSGHFSPSPELWVLQALLLIEVFGKSRAGLKQHEMAHLFHGLLINLIRRSGCESAATDCYGPVDENDPEKSWRSWIHMESMKRLALMTFLWDVQHATFFSQTLCMSAFELKVDLPSDLNLWNSRDSTEWLGYRRSETHPLPYLSTLKKFLNCAESLPYINSLSRVLILHGLMGIAWDMQRRDQTSLNFQIDPSQWKLKLNKAYDHWKKDFDKFSRRIMLKISTNFENTTNKTFFVKYLTTNNAMYHTAVLCLWTNLIDLQIFAGSKVILGMSVNDSTFLKSKRQLTEWVYQIGISDKAVMNAAQLLRCGLTNLENWEVDGTFHYPWCLYLAVLTCWCFFKILKDQSGNKYTAKEDTPAISDDQIKGIDGVVEPIISDTKTSMRKFVSLVTSGTPDEIRSMKNIYSSDLSGMIDEIGSHLMTVRWAIIYEAFKVLKALNEDDDDASK